MTAKHPFISKNTVNKQVITFLTVFFLLGLLVVLPGCASPEKEQKENGQIDRKRARESLEVANRYLVKQEQNRIDDYIRRHQLNVVETGSGLRYAILKNGQGEKVETGKIVQLAYEVKLLTGDRIYSSEEDGLLSFIVGKGGVPSGLEEGIKYLHEGDEAVFIIPSHLAYGLLGDDSRIPPRAALVYQIEVSRLE